MDDWLSLVIYFFGSGTAFFVGVALLITGVAVSFFAAGRTLRLARNLTAAVGAILVAVSATPLPWWLYAVLALLTIGWLVSEGCALRVGKVALSCCPTGIACSLVGGAGL